MESQFVAGSLLTSKPSSDSGSSRTERSATSTSRQPQGTGPKRVNTGQHELVRVPRNNVIGPDDNDDIWAYFISLNASCPSITLQKLITRKKDKDVKTRSSTEEDEEAAPQIKSSRVPLAGGFVIGRDISCDYSIQSLAFSPRHCVIYQVSLNKLQVLSLADKIFSQKVLDGNIITLIFNLSDNGTYINNKLIRSNQSMVLKTGDEIKMVSPQVTEFGEADEVITFIAYPISRSLPYQFNELFSPGEMLGHGTFSVCETCTDLVNGDVYAAKMFGDRARERLPDEIFPYSIGQISGELSLLMSLESENIVSIKAIFDEGHSVIALMEFAEHGDLFSFIAQRGSLSEPEVITIFAQLFSGVKYLQAKNVIHRDLKPENILVFDKANLRVKIADFGLATIIGDKAFTTKLYGTPMYIAPEFLADSSATVRQYGKEVDWWSLGVVLYVCLSGFLPFSKEFSSLSIATQIKSGALRFPSPYWDHISDDAIDLVIKLLRVNPKERISIDFALEHDFMKSHGSLQRDSASFMTSTNAASVETYRMNNWAPSSITPLPLSHQPMRQMFRYTD